MGRPYLGFNEMVKIRAAEGIVHAYRKKVNSDDWAKWAQDNPDEAERLAEVEKMVAEEGLEDG